ncbi:MAG: carbohydrate binding domain-containing protein [Anaerolineae bacterium]|nr:carbohydrate binding domain-containing protein [Anaerolineae bacterium]
MALRFPIRVRLRLRMGGVSIALAVAVLCAVGALGLVRDSTAAPPIATAMPTAAFTPPRGYDPPAPPDLVLAADGAQLKIADPDGYPRIVKLWGGYDPAVGLDFYAQYDLIISNAFTPAQIAAFRAQNPSLRVLYSGVGTYDTDDGPLGSQWINATAPDWRFDCFLRGANQQVLRVAEWNHGMFNMSNDACTTAIVDYLISQFDLGTYDGVFFDRINQQIAPDILDGIDLDHDWIVDSRESVNEKYWRGTQRFLDQVRTRLRAALGREPIVVGNDAPLHYTDQLNGREYELQIRDILDHGLDWQGFRYNYEQWMQASLQPRLTLVMSNPPYWMRAKYGLGATYRMPKAVIDEAAAYYRRMRFGLTTALLEGGLYSYEFGDTWHGNPWWYDEFDGAGLGKGYLGQPLGEAYYALGSLTTANTIANPSFEYPSLAPWGLVTQNTAQAVLDAPAITDAPDGTAAARIQVAHSWNTDDVRLSQVGLPLIQGTKYTLSFWAKAPSPHWVLKAKVHAPWSIDYSYGLNASIDLGTSWQRYWLTFAAGVNTTEAVLSLGVGSGTGEVWIDRVFLQEGTLPLVFRREFEHGIVLCNASQTRQTVPLDGAFSKIDGAQAPLSSILIDDSDEATANFIKYGGWGGKTARDEDWGSTFGYALTTSDPYGFQSQVVWQPAIDYAGLYTVSAWIAPHAECTDTMTYTIQYAGGVVPVAVSQVVIQAGWVTLGAFPFHVGSSGRVTLSNLTRATWIVADALKFESVARYNDGAQVSTITLDGQDGIILLGQPQPTLISLSKTASHAVQFTGRVLTFTLMLAPTKALTQVLPVRVIDANPAPAYLQVLTSTLSSGVMYSSAIDSVIWNGVVWPGMSAISLHFAVQVTDTLPVPDYWLTNRAQVFRWDQADGPALADASVSVHLVQYLDLPPRAYLPLVLKQYGPD